MDQDHLRLLSIFHFVVGGLALLFGFFPVIHLAVGVFILADPGGQISSGAGQPGGPPAGLPQMMGAIFIFAALTAMALAWSFGALLIVAGRNLAQYSRYTLCLVAAAISCLWVPFGTVLGVFTLIVLNRASVKELFGVVPTQ